MNEKLTWIVIPWKKLGRKLSFPTANISLKNSIIWEWTYKINIIVKWKKYRWVWAYIGKDKIFEAHIFDFNEDIYGEEIEVFVLSKIRENKKFSSLQELKDQITKDVEFCKNTFDKEEES